MAEAGQYTFSLNPNESTPESGNASANPSNNTIADFALFKAFNIGKELKDGQVPKRRGPKPDSKPALTRRQELNRHAQRTHRERKEQYIKKLEEQVYSLKDEICVVSRERDTYARENKRLREVLDTYGITLPTTDPAITTPVSADHSSENVSGSYATATNQSDRSPLETFNVLDLSTSVSSQPAVSGLPLNYNQCGTNFVLTLERPCMEHMQMLCIKSQMTEEICGHTLMATCPPQDHIIKQPDVQYTHQIDPNFDGAYLIKLLDLSARLPLNGELTPVAAWAAIRKHSRFFELSPEDFEFIAANLLGRIRCYGFGAVLEEFEVQDAITNLFDTKVRLTGRFEKRGVV